MHEKKKKINPVKLMESTHAELTSERLQLEIRGAKTSMGELIERYVRIAKAKGDPFPYTDRRLHDQLEEIIKSRDDEAVRAVIEVTHRKMAAPSRRVGGR